MINEAWPLRPMGELFEIGAGKTMSAAARKGEDKTPFLRTSNVLWDEIDLTKVDEMAIPPHELQSKLLEPGDLMVCEGGEIGRAAIWNGEIEEMSFQNHLHRLRPLADDVDPRFYVYFLQSAFTQLGIFEGAGNKTTIPNLSRSRLAALNVPQPEIDEQRDVVCVLSRVRDAMKLHDQCTRIAQDLKQAVMRTLFVRGLRGETEKETEIGLIPESWAICSLGALCERAETVDIKREGARIVEYVDVSSISREFLSIETTSKFTLREAPGRARKKIFEGDVIFATVRPTLLRTAYVSAKLNNQICSTAFCVLRPNTEKVVDKFLYYLVQRGGFVEQLAGVESGASYPAVTDRIVKEQAVPVPSLVEQREIVSILEAIDRKIDLHRRKRAVLNDLFEALLHKLMTGEIRAADLNLSACHNPLRKQEARVHRNHNQGVENA